MSDDDAEAFLRDVRAALAASPRPADPSLDALQRIATWLRTPASDEPADADGLDEGDAPPRRDDPEPPPG